MLIVMVYTLRHSKQTIALQKHMSFRYHFLLIISFVFATFSQAQSIEEPLAKYNKETVPYILVDALKKDMSKYLILDTRKKEEYKVSHLPQAIWVGEQLNDTDFTTKYPDKDQAIVVYCSIGVRSEKFGENLQKQGYSNVSNLYGSLFEWKNKGYEIMNPRGNPTDSVHAYTKEWGQYLKKGIKVY